jgi:hypothetical protein
MGIDQVRVIVKRIHACKTVKELEAIENELKHIKSHFTATIKTVISNQKVLL